MARILLVEDELQMQRGLRDNLEFEGFDVATASTGPAGLEQILTGEFDLAILDVMLPGLSGFDLLRKAREANVRTPVIMLTAKGEEIDKVVGLELGADDYITKPFSLRELLARVKAVLRRAESAGTAAGPAGTVRIGELEVDFGAHTALRDGAEVPLTAKEFDILKHLWEHRGKAVTRDDLLRAVWGYEEEISTRTVDNFMLKLRHKVEHDAGNPRHILTVHGTGYRLVP